MSRVIIEALFWNGHPMKPVQGVIDRSHDKGKAPRFLTQTYGRDTLRKTGAWTATCIHQECSSCLY